MELAWSWEQIAITLIWKLCPKGLVLFPQDLILPPDRVLLEDRQSDRISLSFISLTEAHARTHAVNPQQRASTDKLLGRWQQIATVMLWRLAKSVPQILTEADRLAVPAHLVLMTAGHPDGVEWRFIPRWEAALMEAKSQEHEGKSTIEIAARLPARH